MTAHESDTWKLVVGAANAVLVLGMLISLVVLVIPGFRGKKEKKNEKKNEK